MYSTGNENLKLTSDNRELKIKEAITQKEIQSLKMLNEKLLLDKQNYIRDDESLRS
jgi:hypothetical protein